MHVGERERMDKTRSEVKEERGNSISEVTVHAYNPSTQEAMARESQV
jgi:hypothetical protein